MHRPDFVLKYSVLPPASVLLNSSRRIYRSNKAHHKSGNRHNAPCYNRNRMFSHNCKEHLLSVSIYNYPFTFFKKCVTAAFFQLNPAINTAAYKLKLPIKAVNVLIKIGYEIFKFAKRHITDIQQH